MQFHPPLNGRMFNDEKLALRVSRIRRELSYGNINTSHMACCFCIKNKGTKVSRALFPYKKYKKSLFYCWKF